MFDQSEWFSLTRQNALLSVRSCENSPSIEENKAKVSKIENNITEKCLKLAVTVKLCEKERKKAPDVYIRAQDQKKPPERQKIVRPISPKIRPRIKLNLAPPPELPPPIQRVKVVIPEMARMSIKFSTCTTLYKPAQPIYEDYKKIRVRDSTHRATSNAHKWKKFILENIIKAEIKIFVKKMSFG